MANRIVSITPRGSARTFYIPRFLQAAMWRILRTRALFANRILAGYVAPSGSGKYDLVFDHDGPASYNNTGTFATSGEQINAADLGIGGFEAIDAPGMSSDGVNVIEVVLGATIAGTTMGAGGPVGTPGPVAQTVVIHWFTSATRGTEVTNTTNLSGKFIRLRGVVV